MAKMTWRTETAGQMRILQDIPQCDRLEQELFEVVSQMNLPADVEHVRDIKEIGRYGVMGTPALIINGEVKAVGKVPPKIQMIKWLEAYKD